MLHDLANNLTLKRALSPVSVADNTAQVSQVFDLIDQRSAALAILTGSLADADATFTVLIEESDASGSGYTAVADENLNGTEALASFLFSDDDKVLKIGYTGIKRYIRATITPANNASAGLLAAVWIGVPKRRPSENPPA